MNRGSLAEGPSDAVLAAPAPQAGFFRYDGAFLRGVASMGAHHAPEPLLRVLPPLCALAFAIAMPALRARVRANLRRTVGAQSPVKASVEVMRTFAHFGSCLTEALMMGRSAAPPVALQVTGGQHLRAVLAEQRGAILVTAHTGGWEVAGPLLARRFGVEILIAMRREPNARARVIQDRARERSGVKVVHIDGEPLAVLPLFTHLRRGGVVGVQIDRAPDAERALPIELFAMPGRVPSGPFELARATGAPIVPVFAHRSGYLAYEVSVGAPIAVPRRATRDDLVQAGKCAVAEMETFLSAHPTHWFDFGA